ncbi:hypothetical protein SLEP1_g40163 [Rubroshorea leprosula]|uniref:Uncharacterized protein n=1 Tax=Rubroshorea leprosula TaxID=152421 RepID=A0AAV5L2K4_9ROSI|nr:hypothetical protein SLEP1_g40163 [Rubroshorea leprosula]
MSGLLARSIFFPLNAPTSHPVSSIGLFLARGSGVAFSVLEIAEDPSAGWR